MRVSLADRDAMEQCVLCTTGDNWIYADFGRDLFTPNWGAVFILSFDVTGEEFFVGSPSFLHFPGWITGILFFCFMGF